MQLNTQIARACRSQRSFDIWVVTAESCVTGTATAAIMKIHRYTLPMMWHQMVWLAIACHLSFVQYAYRAWSQKSKSGCISLGCMCLASWKRVILSMFFFAKTTYFSPSCQKPQQRPSVEHTRSSPDAVRWRNANIVQSPQKWYQIKALIALNALMQVVTLITRACRSQRSFDVWVVTVESCVTGTATAVMMKRHRCALPMMWHQMVWLAIPCHLSFVQYAYRASTCQPFWGWSQKCKSGCISLGCMCLASWKRVVLSMRFYCEKTYFSPSCQNPSKGLV